MQTSPRRLPRRNLQQRRNRRVRLLFTLVDFIVRTCPSNTALSFPLYLVFPAFASSSLSRRRAVISNRPLTVASKFPANYSTHPLLNVSASVRHGGPFAHPHHGLICNLFIVYVCSFVLEGIVTNFVLGTNHVASRGTLLGCVISYRVVLYPIASRRILSRRVVSCRVASRHAPTYLLSISLSALVSPVPSVCSSRQPLLSRRLSPWNSTPYNMDNVSGQEIPFIVTEDLSSNPAIRADDDAEFVFPTLPTSLVGHSRNNRDQLLLSPGIPRSGRRSVDTSADEDEHRPNPPLTLSTQSSVQFITSTQGNNPGDRTGSLAPVVALRHVLCRVASSRVVSRCAVPPRVKVALCPATSYLLLN